VEFQNPQTLIFDGGRVVQTHPEIQTAAPFKTMLAPFKGD
jgi:hypothetical protein